MRVPLRAAPLLFALVAACGGDERVADTRHPTPIDPATTGTLVVTVRYEGPPPTMKLLNMASVPQCAAAHAEPLAAGDALVHDGKVENAVAWIKAGLGDLVFAVPAEPAVMDQVGCVYVPRVITARVGQPIEFRNSDAMLHNVHGKPTQSSRWNLSLPRQGTARVVKVSKPEVAISVGCDVHPWMQGWVAVVDHPFAGVSGADGRVTLSGVPAGTYTLGVWHERFGTREVETTVTAGGTTALSVTFAGVD